MVFSSLFSCFLVAYQHLIVNSLVSPGGSDQYIHESLPAFPSVDLGKGNWEMVMDTVMNTTLPVCIHTYYTTVHTLQAYTPREVVSRVDV